MNDTIHPVVNLFQPTKCMKHGTDTDIRCKTNTDIDDSKHRCRYHTCCEYDEKLHQ